MYIVIKLFTDLQDDNWLYNVGDVYPRKGLNVTESRIKELSSANNRQGKPLIKLVEEPKEEPKKDLSNLNKVQLMEIAKEKGLNVKQSMNKATLLEKLNSL
jgi:arginine utilization protein RocB